MRFSSREVFTSKEIATYICLGMVTSISLSYPKIDDMLVGKLLQSISSLEMFGFIDGAEYRKYVDCIICGSPKDILEDMYFLIAYLCPGMVESLRSLVEENQ